MSGLTAVPIVSAHPRMASLRRDNVPDRRRLLSYPRERGDDLYGSLSAQGGIRERRITMASVATPLASR